MEGVSESQASCGSRDGPGKVARVVNDDSRTSESAETRSVAMIRRIPSVKLRTSEYSIVSETATACR